MATAVIRTVSTGFGVESRLVAGPVTTVRYVKALAEFTDEMIVTLAATSAAAVVAAFPIITGSKYTCVILTVFTAAAWAVVKARGTTFTRIGFANLIPAFRNPNANTIAASIMFFAELASTVAAAAIIAAFTAVTRGEFANRALTCFTAAAGAI